MLGKGWVMGYCRRCIHLTPGRRRGKRLYKCEFRLPPWYAERTIEQNREPVRSMGADCPDYGHRVAPWPTMKPVDLN